MSKSPGTTRIAERRKRLGFKFSGPSQEAADFLFSRSGKCQAGQKPLTETHGETQTDRRPLPEVREEGKEREHLVFLLLGFLEIHFKG